MHAHDTSMTVAELARRLGAELRGDGGRSVRHIAPLEVAGPEDLSWLGDARYAAQFSRTRAAAVLVSAALPVPPHDDAHQPALILVPDPDLALCDALRWLAPPPPSVPPGVHPTATIESGAEVAPDAAVGPHVFIGQGASVGPRTQLHAGAHVGSESSIGADCTLWPGVVVRERVTIGDRVIIHPNAVIGADGFSFLQRAGRHVKVPQVGSVVVEDDVEIGALSAVDRARSGVTRIGRGTKIDNLVQIGHNAVIGEDCIIVAQVGISGSCVLEHHVVLGGQAGVVDHLRIEAGAQAGARTLMLRDVPAGQTVMGYPAVASTEFFRQQVLLRRLPALQEQVRALLKRVELLESTADHRARS
jgi:UDP-3-O-[3-hydroxymyristoyl] glucosamine N-acyltransferase